MGKKKYYVVWKGHTPGVYDSWEECQQQIAGFTNPIFKSFKDQQLALKAFTEGSENYIGIDMRLISSSLQHQDQIKSPIPDSIAVDAACSGNPGVLEYRGVFTNTGREIFKQGPFPQGTVNIGEFLALVHGLAYLKQKNSSRPVYSDSKTAMVWVRNKKIKTKLERNEVNEKLFQLVDRALYWLKSNTYENQILKWETRFWGEIPADFGRK